MTASLEAMKAKLDPEPCRRIEDRVKELIADYSSTNLLTLQGNTEEYSASQEPHDNRKHRERLDLRS